LSEHHAHLSEFLVEHPYAGLIEIMDRTGLTSEPVLDHIGYYKLSRSLKEAVYGGELDLYQVWCLSPLDSEAQEQFWRNYKDLNPVEFKEKIEEALRCYRAIKESSTPTSNRDSRSI
jgi:hypothetical protein